MNCSQSCPTDNILATVKLSAEEIIATLKTTPKVFSMIEKGGVCEDALTHHAMAKVPGRKTFIITSSGFLFSYFCMHDNCNIVISTRLASLV